jgi:pimeloyl-ACP methyl ester carboxylesterase
MRFFLRLCSVAIVCTAGVAQAPAHHLFFRVTLSPEVKGAQSGRLLIFLRPGTGKDSLDAGFMPGESWIAAREIDALKPGESVDVDGDEIAFPKPLSQAPKGAYQAEAVLDVNHSYTYGGEGEGDIVSGVATLPKFDPGSAAPIPLTLSKVDPPKSAPALVDGVSAFHFDSPSLTAFWGRNIQINGYVVLPPSYTGNGNTTYPTVYWTHGFGGNFRNISRQANGFRKMMESKDVPEMIFVLLDESFTSGTIEFADSVNTGPWGKALTQELIPHLEAQYRMDAKPNGRFLNGHSSGGWATLWLQVAYPNVFGGTWSTSPDPSDFHNFTGPDIYQLHANVYRKANGSPWMLVRDKGKDIASLQDFAKQETVLGAYGGQMSSFDWVFSPKSASGAPEAMFDRVTGEVNPAVAKYWADHYDIALKVRHEWPRVGSDLKGKIHLIVGTADTFHLDESAHLLEKTLTDLGADAKFTYVPGKTHFDLYEAHGDKQALMKQITKEMYAVARPSL